MPRPGNRGEGAGEGRRWIRTTWLAQGHAALEHQQRRSHQPASVAPKNRRAAKRAARPGHTAPSVPGALGLLSSRALSSRETITAYHRASARHRKILTAKVQTCSTRPPEYRKTPDFIGFFSGGGAGEGVKWTGWSPPKPCSTLVDSQTQLLNISGWRGGLGFTVFKNFQVPKVPAALRHLIDLRFSSPAPPPFFRFRGIQLRSLKRKTHLVKPWRSRSADARG